METSQASKAASEKLPAAADGSRVASSAAIANQGLLTARDLARFHAALIADVMSGAVTVNVANAACNSSGKLLKVAEMTLRYGTPGEGQTKNLSLVDGAYVDVREQALASAREKLTPSERLALGLG